MMINDHGSPPPGGDFIRDLEAAMAIEAETMEKNAAYLFALRARAGRIAAAKRAGRDHDEPPVEPSEPARKVAARALGISVPNYYRAKSVYLAAKKDEERFGDLLTKLSRTSVCAAYDRLTLIRNGKQLRPDALYRMKHRDRTKEVDRALEGLDGICFNLARMHEAAALAPAETRERWVEQIQRFRSVLNKFSRRMS